MARSNIAYLLGLAWRLDPARVLLEFLEQAVANGVWVFFSVVFLRYLLQALEAQVPLEQVFFWMGTSLAVIGLSSLLLNWFGARYRPLSDLRMGAALSRRLFEQAVRVDLASYEDEAFFDRFSLALKEAETRVPEFLKQLAGSAASASAAAFTIVTLAQINLGLLAFLLFPLVGNFVFGRWLNRVQYRREVEAAGPRRRIAYVSRVFYLPDYAKEIRLSGVMGLLLEQLRRGYGGLSALFTRYRARAVSANFLFAAFTFLFAFQGSFLYGAWLAIEQKSIDIGTFAVLASATVSASWMLLQLSDRVLNLFKNTLFIENLRSFLAAEPTLVDPPDARPLPPFQTLEFRGVGFSYPGGSSPVLSDLSFALKAGEKVAVVGHNGAGKTSLVKLLMRLYEPTAGAVLYNGRPVSEFRLAAYRALFGTAFQDFKVFSLTVAENVLSRTPRGEDDYERARLALDRAGVLERVLRLPRGLDTVLTREFADDGAQLSGGELQKIAIARAFAGDGDIILLDEPSSALDPVSEYRLYESIKEVWRHKTVLFISHRLSSATLADHILLMEQGRLIEAGTHEELMARQGAYARMFAMQAEHYLEDNFATIGEGE